MKPCLIGGLVVCVLAMGTMMTQDDSVGPATMSVNVAAILFGMTMAGVGSFDFGKVMNWIVPPLAASTIGIPALFVCFVLLSAVRDQDTVAMEDEDSIEIDLSRFSTRKQTQSNSRSDGTRKHTLIYNDPETGKKTTQHFSNKRDYDVAFAAMQKKIADFHEKKQAEAKAARVAQEEQDNSRFQPPGFPGPRIPGPEMGPTSFVGPRGPIGPRGPGAPVGPGSFRPPSTPTRPSGISRPSTTTSNRTTTSSRPQEKRPAGTPGVDSEMAGGEGGFGADWVTDPGGRLVIGIRYSQSSWGGTKTLSDLEPIFDRSAASNSGRSKTVVARTGYALGGINVNATEYVHAVRLLFLKIKPSGSLDPNDYYTTDWLGITESSDEKALLGNGKPVIGFKINEGAVLDSVGLVFVK